MDQSARAEQHIHSLLTEIMGGINRVIALDITMLSELFKVRMM